MVYRLLGDKLFGRPQQMFEWHRSNVCDFADILFVDILWMTAPYTIFDGQLHKI